MCHPGSVRSFPTPPVLAVGLALALVPGTAAAQTTVVIDVFNNDFGLFGTPPSPFDPTIAVGDTVRWHFVQGMHTTTSAAGQAESWSSPSLMPNLGGDPPVFFDHTFTQVGSFNYYCTHHGFDLGGGQVVGMTGTITVQPVPEPVHGLLAATLAGGLAYGVRRRGKGVRPSSEPAARPGRGGA
jgi:plastocyanin